MRGVAKEAQSLGRFYIVSLSGDEIGEAYAELDAVSPRPRQAGPSGATDRPTRHDDTGPS
jgi:hypothetical protein